MPKQYYKKKVDPLDLIKIGGGWSYYCIDCDKKYRYKQLLPKLERSHEMFYFMTCPQCGEMVIDLKRK